MTTIGPCTRLRIDRRRAPETFAVAKEAPPPALPEDGDPVLPPELQFEPVPRRRKRSNGLTPKRQRQFIHFLAITGSVQGACRLIGCSDFAIYNLRNAAGAEEFARAWERAVARGAGRVIDVMLDHAVNGVPEAIVKDGAVVGERRSFNLRGQMFIAQNYLGDRFGGTGGGRSRAAAALKDQLRAEIADEARRDHDATVDEIAHRLERVREGFKRAIAGDPARRAAWTLLTGDEDWSGAPPPDDPERRMAAANLNRAENIVAIAAVRDDLAD